MQIVRTLLCISACVSGLVNLSIKQSLAQSDDTKHVVFIAGSPSHGYGSHEHYAGCRILAETLEQRGFPVTTEVVQNGWPQDASVLEKATTIVIYSDGGGGHPALAHLDAMKELMDKGVGLVCIHYAVEVPKDRGGAEFKQWLGGYFETDWSVNPHWVADYQSLPEHPITAGVKPFKSNDEWYFHMRFNESIARLTPILTAVPPESTMSRPDGSHSGNAAVRAEVAQGKPQHMAWAFERENGGRSFGFTGGHFHWNWGRHEYTDLLTNAIAWTAGCQTADIKHANDLTVETLAVGQDEPRPSDFNAQHIHDEFQIPVSISRTMNAKKSGGKLAKAAYRSPLVDSSTPGHRVNVSVPTNGAKKIFLVVTDGGNGFACDWANWLNPVFISGDGKQTKLTDLKWSNASTGWGQVNVNRNVGGQPLRVANESFASGIGTHANSVIEFAVPDGTTKFEAIGGLDMGGTAQQGGNATSVHFAVYLDEAPRDVGSGDTSDELRDPLNAVAGLDTHEGVETQLAASEPELKSLTNIDIDHRGRVWVCEVVNYRQHRNDRAEGDRILILEDTDHDGVMDASKVFYQGRDVDSALGICVLGNRILVSAAPYVIEFIDNNGDDVPDSKSYAFTNTGDPQHDHSIHSFVIGPDNKLYFNFGNTGHRLCDANGNPFLDAKGRPINDAGNPYRQGMAFRCNLDFSEMEVLGDNFRNNYELAVDSFGTVWQSDNDDDGNRGTRINYVMEGGNFGYVDEMTGDGWQRSRLNMEDTIPQQHWHLNDPGVVPTMLMTGAGSPTGITIYESDLLPGAFRNQIIHCDAGPNVVRAYPVTNDGAGYSASIQNLLEGTRDKWFRPADVCVAPDGSVFVSDWYDPGVGGHLMQDTARGRLFRIAPPGTKYVVPEYDFSTIDGAIAALQSPTNSVRYLAMQALVKFGKAAEPALQNLLESEDTRMAARALFLLVQLSERGDEHLAFAYRHADANMRIAAIRAARIGKRPMETIFAALENESDVQVLRELVLALQNDESEEMASRWAELANKYPLLDRWYLEALGIAARDRWDACLDAYLGSSASSMNDHVTQDIVWRSRASKTGQLIADFIVANASKIDNLEYWFRALDFQPAAGKQAAYEIVLKLADGDASSQTDHAIALAALGMANMNFAVQSDAVNKAVVRYIKSIGSDESQLTLIDRLKIPGMAEHLIDLSLAMGDNNAGIRAVELALRDGGLELLQPMILIESENQPVEKLAKAQRLVRSLSLSNREDARELMRKIMESPQLDSTLRITAATGLARTREGQRYLVGLAQAGILSADAITVVAGSLRNARDEEISATAKKLFPEMVSAGEPLPPIENLIRRQGNVDEGKRLFATTATCAQCHVVAGVGKNVGPDLTEIGTKLTKEAMYVAVLNPSAGISHNYEAYSVLTDDGQVITGLLVSRNDDEIVVKDKDGIERKFSVADVEVKKLEVSLMPNNLQDLTGQQGLVDVIEYMTTLKKKE